MHDAAKTAGVGMNTLNLLNSEIGEFKELVRNAVVLGGFFGGVPTLQSLGWMDIETPYDTKTTQILASMILADHPTK